MVICDPSDIQHVMRSAPRLVTSITARPPARRPFLLRFIPCHIICSGACPPSELQRGGGGRFQLVLARKMAGSHTDT